MDALSGEKHRVVVEIDAPDEIVERARQRAGDTGNIEAHLLDQCVFEYKWVGVEGAAQE